MSKLFKLKSWLTLEEAADHLHRALQEPVTVPDVLRLAVDGHLTLSTNLVNKATVNLGEKKAWSDAKIVLIPRLEVVGPDGLPKELQQKLLSFPRHLARKEQEEWLSQNRDIADHPDIVIFVSGDAIEDGVLEWEQEVRHIGGVWDLPNFGGASLDVEHLLQSLVGGPEVTLVSMDGTFVVSPDGRTYARILDRFEEKDFPALGKEGAIGSGERRFPYDDPKSYYPRGGLPEDAPIVVRPGALAAFIADLEEEERQEPEKPLRTRERNNLLRVINALCKEAKIDLSNGKGGVAAVDAAVAMAGFDGPKERTLRNILRYARDVE